MTDDADAQQRTGQWFHRNRFAGLFAGSHLSGTVVVSTAGHTLIRMDRGDVEVPAGSPLFDHLLDRARNSGRVYLTRDGARVGAVVSVEIADSLDVGGDGPPPFRRRTLDELRWEQGIEPVDDPAELQGEVLAEADFAEFHAAVMSAGAP